MGFWKKAWSDPVGSKVIAGVILAALAAAGTYFLHWWPAIGCGIYAIFSFLIAKTPVWNWLLGLMIAGIVVILVVVVTAYSAAKQQPVDSLTSYTTDEFCGVRWRWRYSGQDVVNLHCLRMKCGLQIYFLDVSDFRAVPRVASKCDDCGDVVGPFDGNYEMRENRSECVASSPRH